MTIAGRVAMVGGAVAVLGLCLWIATAGRGGATATPARTSAAAHGAGAMAPSTAPTVAPPPAVPALAEDASIEDKVRALTASGDPAQALQAYQMVEQCVRLEHDKELFATDVKVVQQGPDAGVSFVSSRIAGAKLQALTASCSTLSGRTGLDHHQLLQYAVDHHAGGALSVYIQAGPQGDANALRERPSDPAVIAWRDGALRRLDDGVRAGEPDALLSALGNYALLGKDVEMPEVLTLHLAANEVIGAINHDGGPFPHEVLERWAATLTPQQRVEAENEAGQIYRAWQQRQR